MLTLKAPLPWMMTDRLSEYRRKRDFAASPEPPGSGHGAAGARFVVQLHHARSRHFDFRLQVDNTLRSWAVPKGPSMDPDCKRLAVEVEDHPLDYGTFEGTIPQGHYGAGNVRIWDEGHWSTHGDAHAALNAGHLHFDLRGRRLKGAWSLVRTRSRGKTSQWLLIKARDAHARRHDVADDTPLAQWKIPDGKQRKATPVSRKPRDHAFPLVIDLQLACLAERAPTGDQWAHETKFDGYRVLLWRNGDTVRITSRGNQDWTGQLQACETAMRDLRCHSCILDGELVAFDRKGRSDFNQLQHIFGGGKLNELAVMLFDLLYLDGDDWRHRPLAERKAALAALLASAPPPLHYASHVIGRGPTVAHEACVAGQEGIISKDLAAPYVQDRSGAWLKIKCVQSDEFAVIGYTQGKGARTKLGALLLAQPQGARYGAWRYGGRVGTGLDAGTISELLQRLKPVRQPPPLDQVPERAQLRGASPLWVKPEVVVEVEYRGITGEGLLRQASLKGLRTDRSVSSLRPGARDRARASAGKARADRRIHQSAARVGQAADGSRSDGNDSGAKRIRAMKLTHPDRVLFHDPTITKRDLAAFYTDIAEFILPGLVGRPLLLMRCPDGDGGECFFQKHLSRGFPEAVREVLDPVEKQRWIYVDDLDGLLGLVQMSVLELHVWGSTVHDIDHADRLVIDLDPGDGVAWKTLVAAAVDVRERLAHVGLRSFVRTTGGKGLHVVTPLRPAVPWDSAHHFAQALARTLAKELPERYVDVASQSRRAHRIFVDYLRNGRGATAVASYSLRNRPGAPVAVPLEWSELKRLRSPRHYTYANLKRRLSRMSANPWEGIDTIRQSLPPT